VNVRFGGGAALVLVLAVCAGCGSAPTTVPSAGGAPAQVRVSPRVRRWEARLDRLYLRIAGSPVERDAGEEVAFHIEQDPFTACMRSHGIDYPDPVFSRRWAYWPAHGAAAFDTRWLASLTDPLHLAKVLQGEAAAQHPVHRQESKSDHRYEDLGPAARKAWDAAVKSCHEGAGYEEAWHPRLYYTLLGRFHALVDGVDLSLAGFSAGYRACMMRAGFRAHDHQQLVSHLEHRLGMSADVPVPGKPGNAHWQAWLSVARGAGVADASCRARAHASAWARLGPRIAVFEHRYRGLLRREDAAWAALRRRAAALSAAG
jgi:hypothetical protein